MPKVVFRAARGAAREGAKKRTANFTKSILGRWVEMGEDFRSWTFSSGFLDNIGIFLPSKNHSYFFAVICLGDNVPIDPGGRVTGPEKGAPGDTSSIYDKNRRKKKFLFF